MIQKFIYGNPIETDAVVQDVVVSVGAIPYGGYQTSQIHGSLDIRNILL